MQFVQRHNSDIYRLGLQKDFLLLMLHKKVSRQLLLRWGACGQMMRI